MIRGKSFVLLEIFFSPLFFIVYIWILFSYMVIGHKIMKLSKFCKRSEKGKLISAFAYMKNS